MAVAAHDYKFSTQRDGASIYAFSSAGPDFTSFGVEPDKLAGGFDAHGLYNGERARELDFRSSFYRAKNHDTKPFDMDGALLAPSDRNRGFAGAGELMQSVSGGPGSYVPMSVRRPHAPYRIGRTIVRAYTGMLYGHSRWPGIRSDDPDTQAFGEAIVEAANLRNRMVRGRNIAGACGTAALSWFFRKGSPRVRVHAGRFMHVHEWDDVDDHVVAHATELYQSDATRKNEDGAVETYRVWVRRDWTQQADVVFKPVEVTGENPAKWEIDVERSFVHGDGFAHVVWLLNYPDDDDPSSIDGQPDYAELYEPMGTLDMSNSIAVRGVGRNLDPTLVLNMDLENVGRALIKKGSDNAIVTGEGGDAKYATIPGDVVDSGAKFVDKQRNQILEVAQCVVPDPDSVLGAGSSSVAMKIIYSPMIGTADVLREPNGHAIVQLLEQMRASAAKRMGAKRGVPPEEQDPGYEVPVDAGSADPANDDGGTEDPTMPRDTDADEETFEHEALAPADQEPVAPSIEYYLDLPPKRVVTIGPDGKKTETVQEIHPGNGRFSLEWGEYFDQTSADKQAATSAVSSAAGGKAVLSQQTAVDLAANLYDKDADQEWSRVQAERLQQGAYDQQGMFPSPDATVPDDPAAQLPTDPTQQLDPQQPDADTAVLQAGIADSKDGLLGVADIPAVLSVNEARAAMALGPWLKPDGTPDPDGNLSVEEFRAKRAAKGEGDGEAAAPVQPQDAPDPMRSLPRFGA